MTLPPAGAAPGRSVVHCTFELTSIDVPLTTPVAVSVTLPVRLVPVPVRATVVSLGETLSALRPGIIEIGPVRPVPPPPNGEPPAPPFDPGFSLTPAHATNREPAAQTNAIRQTKLCMDRHYTIPWRSGAA